MAKRFWKRRNLLIAAGIVVLSIGIVFASIPFLPSQSTPHSTLTQATNISVDGESQPRPGSYALKLPPLTANQNFWVGVNVTGGTASFCVMEYQGYENWRFSTNYYPLTQTSCLVGPTQQEQHDTLKFAPSSAGTWVVVALNVNPKPIMVYFLPAP